MLYMNDVVIHYFRFRHDGSGWYDTISVNGLDNTQSENDDQCPLRK